MSDYEDINAWWERHSNVSFQRYVHEPQHGFLWPTVIWQLLQYFHKTVIYTHTHTDNRAHAHTNAHKVTAFESSQLSSECLSSRTTIAITLEWFAVRCDALLPGNTHVNEESPFSK